VLSEDKETGKKAGGNVPPRGVRSAGQGGDALAFEATPGRKTQGQCQKCGGIFKLGPKGISVLGLKKHEEACDGTKRTTQIHTPSTALLSGPSTETAWQLRQHGGSDADKKRKPWQDARALAMSQVGQCEYCMGWFSKGVIDKHARHQKKHNTCVGTRTDRAPKSRYYQNDEGEVVLNRTPLELELTAQVKELSEGKKELQRQLDVALDALAKQQPGSLVKCATIDLPNPITPYLGGDTAPPTMPETLGELDDAHHDAPGTCPFVRRAYLEGQLKKVNRRSVN